MSEEQIVDIWTLFKEYLDKKNIDAAAERFVDMLADYGVSDETLTECFGADHALDAAIRYYLDLDTVDEDDDVEWD